MLAHRIQWRIQKVGGRGDPFLKLSKYRDLTLKYTSVVREIENTYRYV